MIVWRLCRARHARRPLDGEGARLYGGRWNPPGVSVVYASATLSLAALEQLVHVEIDLAPRDLVSLRIHIPDAVRVDVVPEHELPADWRHTPAPAALQQIGLAWLNAARTLLLRVPSAIIPDEHNVLINPQHAEAKKIVVDPPRPFVFDPRLV